MQDAYFELIGYPVGIAAAANERYFRSELARPDQARGRSPNENLKASKDAGERIRELTVFYNEKVADGKWEYVVTENGVSHRDWIRFQPQFDSEKPVPAADNVCPPAPSEPSELIAPLGARSGDFVERDGIVSMNAGHFTKSGASSSASEWKSVPGLGRSGSVVTLLPSDGKINPVNPPGMSYVFHVTSGGEATLHVRLLPTHPLATGQGLRFKISIDGGADISLAVTDGFNPKKDPWKLRVLANATEVVVKLPKALKPGEHTLFVKAVDAGVVIDKFIIDFGGLQPSCDWSVEARMP